MDAERELVSKLVHSGSWEEALSSGIVEDHFEDAKLKEVFVKCVEHFRKYRSAPSAKTVRELCPDVTLDIVTDSVQYCIDQFVLTVKRRRAIDALRDLGTMLDDPSKIANIDALFLERARILAQLIPSTSTTKFSDMKGRVQQYNDQLAIGASAMGIPIGIPSFDAITLGIQKHEYISIVGWQGTGKSTLAQWMLFNAYMAGYTPMIISLEMEGGALMRKWDAMATHFKYSGVKGLTLSQQEVEAWEKSAERAAKAKNDIIVLDDVGRCTVDKVYAEAVRYKPDILCVDYVSLMMPSRATSQMWEAVTMITQGLKQVARNLGVPIIGVAQTNRDSAADGARLENISYSRSIGQDSDIVFGLHRDDDMKAERQMEVRMMKNRDGRTASAKLFWDLERMQIEEWSPKHMFAAKEGE